MARTRRLRRVDPREPRGRIYHAVCRFSASRAGGWLSVNVAWRIDPHLLKLTGGRFSTAAPVPAALLETRGARTGSRAGTPRCISTTATGSRSSRRYEVGRSTPPGTTTSAAIPTCHSAGSLSAPRSWKTRPSGNDCGSSPIASTPSTPNSALRPRRPGGSFRSFSWCLSASEILDSVLARGSCCRRPRPERGQIPASSPPAISLTICLRP